MFRKGHRESTTPMDFEYDNKYGPVDQQSPFLTSIANSPARRRELEPTAPSPLVGQGIPQLSKGPRFGQAGPQSQFDSPTKNAFATPSRLRETAFNFSQSGAKPLPSIPQHVNNTWTPRTPVADYDFSSGGETPNTPAQDSEQATPDTQMAGRMQLLMDSPSPKKTGKRQSLFRTIRSWGSPSPSKESSLKEIEKEVSRKHYNEKLENRVVKRRSTRERPDRSKKKRMVACDDDESEIEPAQAQKGAPAESIKMQQTYGASIAGFFHWIEAHPRLPTVLAYYLQFAVNAFFLLLFMWVVYIMLNAVFADINIESDKHHSEVMVEIAQCAKNYRENYCGLSTRAPALEMACGNWETCMSRDPQKLARASVTVKACARIINSFFEEFSYKSMVCSTALILAFGFVWSEIRKQCKTIAEVGQESRPLANSATTLQLSTSMLHFRSSPAQQSAPRTLISCDSKMCNLHQPLNFYTVSLTQTLNNRSSLPSLSLVGSTSQTGLSVCSASSTPSLRNHIPTSLLRKRPTASPRTATLRTGSRRGRHHTRRRMKGEGLYNNNNRPCCSIRRVRRRCRVMRNRGRGRR